MRTGYGSSAYPPLQLHPKVPCPWALNTYSTVISNVKQLPILAGGSDFLPGPRLENGTEYELQAFIVASSLHDVSFVQIVHILLIFALLRVNTV